MIDANRSHFPTMDRNGDGHDVPSGARSASRSEQELMPRIRGIGHRHRA